MNRMALLRSAAVLRMTLGFLLFGCLAARAATPDRYNVVWDSPSADSNGTMPLGNGEIALNAWVEPTGSLRFFIARTDAWDEYGRLLKVGGIRLTLDPNPFAAAPGFRQELDLKTGSILIRAEQAGRNCCRGAVTSVIQTMRCHARRTWCGEVTAGA